MFWIDNHKIGHRISTKNLYLVLGAESFTTFTFAEYAGELKNGNRAIPDEIYVISRSFFDKLRNNNKFLRYNLIISGVIWT